MPDLYVGLMSGTSLDGVDAVLARLAPGTPPHILAAVTQPYPEGLRTRVLAVCRDQGGAFSTLGRIDIELARWYAQAVQALLDKAGVAPAAVRSAQMHSP